SHFPPGARGRTHHSHPGAVYAGQGCPCLIFASFLPLLRSGFPQVKRLFWPLRRSNGAWPQARHWTGFEAAKGDFMRPAIYGYMRVVSSDETDDESGRVKRELATYAQREGFTLDLMFTENIRCSESAFSVMLDALKRHDVRDVIV